MNFQHSSKVYSKRWMAPSRSRSFLTGASNAARRDPIARLKGPRSIVGSGDPAIATHSTTPVEGQRKEDPNENGCPHEGGAPVWSRFRHNEIVRRLSFSRGERLRRVERLDWKVERPDWKVERPDWKVGRLDMKVGRLDLKVGRLDLKAGRTASQGEQLYPQVCQPH
jgi:hypothetical protein